MNKKQFSIGIVCTFVFLTLSSSVLFFKSSTGGKFDQYQGYHGLDPLNLDKKKDGSMVAYTQSAHDQTAPGTCSGCHGGGSTVPVITVTADPPFGIGNTYVPGTVYTITYSANGYPFYGLDVEMNAGNTVTSMTAGTLAAKKNTRFTANPFGQGFPSNISHTARIPKDSVAIFTWTAPAVGTEVYFFSNTVGANGNNNDTGDKEAFMNFILLPEGWTSVEEKNVEAVEMQVSPNPASDLMTVKYNLKTSSAITITLLDSQGKTVLNLVNEIQSPGLREHTFDTDRLANGSYILKLSIDGKVSSKKIMVY